MQTEEQYDILGELREQAKHPKRKPKKAKVEVKKPNYKAIFYAVVIGLAVIVSATMYGLEQYAKWRTTNEWQFPAKWIGFVRKIEKLQPVLAQGTEAIKPMSNQEIVDASRHPDELNMIWTLESGKGTNDNPEALHNYCKSKGETNEFGWGGMQNMICFKTFQESVDRVSQWLDVREAETYCYYATGKEVTDCSYMDRVNIEKL